MTMTLTQDEVGKRVALLKRLKATLSQQREKFQSYLKVLDAEKASIEADAVDTLRSQVELEEELLVDIHAIQKVIDPLETILQQAYQGSTDDEVVDLKISLDALKTKVQERSRENRGLLSRAMETLNHEIVRVRPQVRSRNPYASPRTSSLVDITT